MMTQVDIERRLLNQISSLASQVSSLSDIINELNEQNARLHERLVELEVEKTRLIKGEVDLNGNVWINRSEVLKLIGATYVDLYPVKKAQTPEEVAVKNFAKEVFKRVRALDNQKIEGIDSMESLPDD